MMPKKKVLLATGAYPYYPGEQFIEDEIRYWSDQNSMIVIIAPMSARGIARKVPPSILVDHGLANGSVYCKIISIFQALCSDIFRREVLYVLKTPGPLLRRILVAFKTVTDVFFFEKKITPIVRQNKIDVFYSYWNDTASYAAIILREKGLLKSVITRTHGFDLYEERRKNNYMPLKRQFINSFDYVFAGSEIGKLYIETKYEADPSQIVVSRLGVPISEDITNFTTGDCLNILSVSFCVSVKRIDKIVEAIRLASHKLENTRINWTHIGDGPLLDNLKIVAINKLDLPMISYRFTGRLEKFDVMNFYSSNDIDIFINASESEGVPVSIMEAMSFGVPVIAPDVGGVREIVSNMSGVLLGKNPDATEISHAIVALKENCKSVDFRARVKQWASSRYDSNKNYSAFIEFIALM